MQNFFINSGISLNAKGFATFIVQHPFIAGIFRLKISPLTLQEKLSPKEFSAILSRISIGPAFKTTSFSRHRQSDIKIAERLKDRSKVVIADIGVSDGTSALHLYEKLQNKLEKYMLFDKYTEFIYKKGFVSKFYNNDNELVYIKIGPLLIYTYPYNSSKSEGIKISFDNPKTKKLGLKIQYFDVFTSVSKVKFDVIKCANLFNVEYFSNKQILKGINNIMQSLKSDGYLFIIHNNSRYQNKEALIILQKTEESFKFIENMNNHELGPLLGDKR